MELLLDDHERQVRSGGSVHFPFRVLDVPVDASNLTYQIDVRERGFDPRWCRVAPPPLGAEGGSVGQLVVEIPIDASPPAGTYHVTLVVHSGAGRAAAAECAVTVESSRCARFSALPRVSLNPDGSLTATVSLLNCGNLNLDVSIDVRHQGGWRFEAETPDLTLQTGVGPVEATFTYRLPGDRRASPGDEVTVELRHAGTLLHQIDARLSGARTIGVRRPRPSPLLLVAALVVALAGVTTLATSPISDRRDPEAVRHGSDPPSITTLSSTTAATSVPTTSVVTPTSSLRASTTAPPSGATTTTLRPGADLFVDAQLTPTALWIITVRNDGPATATSLVLTLSSVNAAFGPVVSADWSCTGAVCTLDRLRPAQVTTVQVPLQLQACGSSVRATATAQELDPDTGDNNIGFAGADCPSGPG